MEQSPHKAVQANSARNISCSEFFIGDDPEPTDTELGQSQLHCFSFNSDYVEDGINKQTMNDGHDNWEDSVGHDTVVAGDWQTLPPDAWAAIHKRFHRPASVDDSRCQDVLASSAVNDREIETMMRAMMKDMKELHDEMKHFRGDAT